MEVVDGAHPRQALQVAEQAEVVDVPRCALHQDVCQLAQDGQRRHHHDEPEHEGQDGVGDLVLGLRGNGRKKMQTNSIIITSPWRATKGHQEKIYVNPKRFPSRNRNGYKKRIDSDGRKVKKEEGAKTMCDDAAYKKEYQ